MLGFIVSVAVLVLLALLLIVPALLKKPEVDDEHVENFDEQNIRIARERAGELKQDVENQRITQEVYDKATDELEKNLALDLSISEQQNNAKISQQPAKGLGLILLVLIPLAASLIYWQLGDYQSIEKGSGRIADKMIGEPGKPQVSMQEAVNKLRARLEAEPDNAQGWFMLARSYATMERYADAADAYKKTIELSGDDADLLLRYADTLVMRDGGQYTEHSAGLIKQALALDPKHPQGLWMAGMAENAAGNPQKALAHWYVLDPLLNDNISAQTQLHHMIKKAEALLGSDQLAQIKKPSNPFKPMATKSMAAPAAASIKVSISLDASLANKVSADDVVFVFAKAMQGPPMPLAAVRKTVADLPLNITLSDAMAMMPNMKLSSFKQVRIAAVVSKSGRPGLSAGDLYGEKQPVNVKDTTSINIVIDKVK